MQARLDEWVTSGLYRENIVLDERIHHRFNFASNDYLALTVHPDVVAAFIKGVQTYGFGSGSAAAIVGYFKPQYELEERFAHFLQREKAILFNSGYHANLGIMSAVANRSSTVVADKLCHASILDGIQLSRATLKRFLHHDLQQADSFIEKALHPVLVTESIFSMEGDITPIFSYAKIAKKNGALFIVDDAHALGVLGEKGRGSLEHFNMPAESVDLLVSPLGKACAGMGAIVSGHAEWIDGLKQFSRTYRYTTALPPATLCGLLAALTVLEQESWRRNRLNQLAQYFVTQAKSRQLRLISEDLTPIKCIWVGDNLNVLAIQKALLKDNIYVSAIRPPTVPKGSARLRVSLNCLHEENDINTVLDRIAEYVDHE